MEQQLPTYVGPLEPFEFTVSDQVQGQYLEALEDYHLRYVLSHQGISPVIHPGILLSHSNATRSPSFGGPNTRWIHMREQTHFTASARLTDGVVALERIMWGFRSSAERPIPPGSRYARPGSADSFPPSRTAKPTTLGPADWELPGKLKRPTAERIRLFSGWAAQNLHTDDQIAKAAGLPAPVASAAQGMGYLCEFMIDNLGEEWLTGGSWVLTFTKPHLPRRPGLRVRQAQERRADRARRPVHGGRASRQPARHHGDEGHGDRPHPASVTPASASASRKAVLVG